MRQIRALGVRRLTLGALLKKRKGDNGMAESFKKYRRECFDIIRELLEHRGDNVVALYILRAKNSRTEFELSRVMVDVRHEI